MTAGEPTIAPLSRGWPSSDAGQECFRDSVDGEIRFGLLRAFDDLGLDGGTTWQRATSSQCKAEHNPNSVACQFAHWFHQLFHCLSSDVNAPSLSVFSARSYGPQDTLSESEVNRFGTSGRSIPVQSHGHELACGAKPRPAHDNGMLDGLPNWKLCS